MAVKCACTFYKCNTITNQQLFNFCFVHKHNLETAWIPDFFCSNYNVKKVVMVLIWDLFLDQISSYLSLLGNLPSTPLAAPSKMVTATMALNEHIWAVQWQLLAKGPPCHLKNQLQARTERYSPSNTWEFTILTLNILLHLPTKTHKTSTGMGR